MRSRCRMFEVLPRFIAWLMNRVRVNQAVRGVRNGLTVIIKRRRMGYGLVIWFGNQFLSMARSNVQMFVRTREWKKWEAYCSHLLYPERPGPVYGSGNDICLAEVSGTSLRQLLYCRETDLSPFAAAARELRRVHQIHCQHFQAAWSHGDLHLDNILYDRTTDLAILIDFDTRHKSGIDETWRHCDDLSVFLLELISSDDTRWLELATVFVEEYGNEAVLRQLDRRLAVPHGFAKILWYTRTQCAPFHQTESRLQCLRQVLRRITSVTEH